MRVRSASTLSLLAIGLTNILSAGTVTSVISNDNFAAQAVRVTSNEPVLALTGVQVVFTFTFGVLEATFTGGQANSFLASLSYSGFGDTAAETMTLTTPFVNNSQDYLLMLSIIGASPGAQSGTAFDRTNPNPGTLASSTGRDVVCVSCIAGDVTAIYQGPISIVGASAAGDLFSRLTLDFTSIQNVGGGAGLALAGQSMSFQLDTDLLIGPITDVPEPTSFGLWGTGLAMLRFVMGRYRNKGCD